MRAFDRDLIRAGHYGQRSCEPHKQAEHMAAPTNAAYVKKALANTEPSTHGTKLASPMSAFMSAFGGWSQWVDATLHPETERWIVWRCIKDIFGASDGSEIYCCIPRPI